MAKRFKFKLDAVLRVRHIEAEQAKKAFADGQRQVIEARSNVESFLVQEEEAKLHLVTLTQNKMDIHRLRLQKQYLHGINRKIMDAAQVLNGHLSTLEILRLKLQEAMRGERAMELLRERRFVEYQYALNREEQLQLDELNDRKARTGPVPLR